MAEFVDILKNAYHTVIRNSNQVRRDIVELIHHEETY